MAEDIRNKAYLTHDDVVGLNFIKSAGPFVFRRHFRQGLRSHVMALLRPSDLEVETKGTVIDGVRWFPKAKPFKILRLFRTRLDTLEAALNEITRVKLVEQYLAPDNMACSDEFVVDYAGPQGMSLMLCGLQNYIEGEVLDPWCLLEDELFQSDLYERMRNRGMEPLKRKAKWIQDLQNETAIFIQKVKTMMTETDHIPDLAGVGNLMVVPSGKIKLVDINNISAVSNDGTIALDDRGYPVCDKSIEALARLEQKILGRTVDLNGPIYRGFLTPQRMEAVKIQEERFYRKLNSNP